MLFSGLEDTDGRNVKEIIELEAAEHKKNNIRTCQNTDTKG